MMKGNIRFLPNLLSRGHHDVTGGGGGGIGNNRNDPSNKNRSLPTKQQQLARSKPNLSNTLTQLQRKQNQHPHQQLPQQNKLLSHNAAHVLYTGRRHDYDDNDENESNNSSNDGDGYAIEVYSNCDESVSSLNDSCMDGASVTGGYNVHHNDNDNNILPSTTLDQQQPQLYNINHHHQPTTLLLNHATSLVVGIVPMTLSTTTTSNNNSIATPSWMTRTQPSNNHNNNDPLYSNNNNISFDETEETSYRIDIEQPKLQQQQYVQQSLLQVPYIEEYNNQQANIVDDTSLLNKIDGRLRTIVPLITGTCSPKKKKKKQQSKRSTTTTISNQEKQQGVTKTHNHTSIVQSSTTMTSTATNSTCSNHKGVGGIGGVLPTIETTSVTSHTTLPPENSSRTERNHRQSSTDVDHKQLPEQQQQHQEERLPKRFKILFILGCMLLFISILIAIIGLLVTHQSNQHHEKQLASSSLNQNNINANTINDTIPPYNSSNASNIFNDEASSPSTTTTRIPDVVPTASPSTTKLKGNTKVGSNENHQHLYRK
jgi:hypothetical protein